MMNARSKWVHLPTTLSSVPLPKSGSFKNDENVFFSVRFDPEVKTLIFPGKAGMIF